MATSKAEAVSTRLITPPFRVSFPQVFEKAAFNDGKPRYSLAGLFYPTGSTDGKGLPWTDGGKAKWSAIMKKLDEVAIEMFKKGIKELKLSRDYKWPIHKGGEKTYEGYTDPKM